MPSWYPMLKKQRYISRYVELKSSHLHAPVSLKHPKTLGQFLKPHKVTSRGIMDSHAIDFVETGLAVMMITDVTCFTMD